MPLTAPSTLTRSERSQSSVVRLWMRPLGASTPALLMSTSSAAEALDRERDDGFDVGDLTHVGEHGLDRAARRRASR